MVIVINITNFDILFIVTIIGIITTVCGHYFDYTPTKLAGTAITVSSLLWMMIILIREIGTTIHGTGYNT